MACLLTGFMTRNNDFWFPARTKAYHKTFLTFDFALARFAQWFSAPDGFEMLAKKLAKPNRSREQK
jgi:hypothetical protein